MYLYVVLANLKYDATGMLNRLANMLTKLAKVFFLFFT